jgi:hypothetical protein
MKAITYLLLITGFFGISAFAQKSKTKGMSLPADIAQWSGQDSDKILNDPTIKVRLKALLGKKNYASFMESFETLTPINRNGYVLFSSGCLIHACTHLESAIAIDLKANTIHAAIYNEEEKTRYFNERGSKISRSISDWAKRLNDLKNNKTEAIVIIEKNFSLYDPIAARFSFIKIERSFLLAVRSFSRRKI